MLEEFLQTLESHAHMRISVWTFARKKDDTTSKILALLPEMSSAFRVFSNDLKVRKTFYSCSPGPNEK